MNSLLKKVPKGLFINSKFVLNDNKIAVYNRETGETLTHIIQAQPDDIEAAIKAGQESYEQIWKYTSPLERQDYLYKLALKVEEHKDYLSQLETLDSGKPVQQSGEDIDFCIETLKYFSTLTTVQGRVVTSNANLKMETRKEPFGCVGLITPWNYPLLQTLWKLSPALAFGNTVVLKPSEYSSLSTLFLGQLLQEIELPKGVVNILTGDGKVGEQIVKHNGLEMVSFTGSDRTGKQVISGGALANIKKVAVELGGKSCVLVHKDALLDNAVQEVFWGCMYNMGQNCVASTRLLLHQDIYSSFLLKFKQYALNNTNIGDVFDKNTNFGLLNSQMQHDKFLSYVKWAEEQEHIELLLNRKDFEDQLKKYGQKGYQCWPVVATGVKDNDKIAQEEIFGPFLSVLAPYSELKEGISRANNSNYGLGAGVFTESMDVAREAQVNLKAGNFWVNMYNLAVPQMPFSGFKQSGFSKETGEEAQEEYTRTKSCYQRFNN